MIDENGSPTFNGHSELDAINVFLGLKRYQSVAFVLAHPCVYTLNDKPGLVIERLEYLLERGNDRVIPRQRTIAKIEVVNTVI